VAVHEQVGSVFTVAVFTGERSVVERGIQAYLKDYAPAGYATRWVSPPVEIRDGYFEARLIRYSSCD
jgi:hypothetical protein